MACSGHHSLHKARQFGWIRVDSTGFDGKRHKIFSNNCNACDTENRAENREILWYNRAVIEEKRAISARWPAGAETGAHGPRQQEIRVFVKGKASPLACRFARGAQYGQTKKSRQKARNSHTKNQNLAFFGLRKATSFVEKPMYNAKAIGAQHKRRRFPFRPRNAVKGDKCCMLHNF